MEAIDSDVQAVLWNRSPQLQADELGSSQEGRKWLTFPSYPRVGANEDGPLLGVGLLPMAEHTRALQAIWIVSRTSLGRPAPSFSIPDSRYSRFDIALRMMLRKVCRLGLNVSWLFTTFRVLVLGHAWKL
eukprot:scaffold96591_cov35-Tisochrysis_lutea.AAC.1